PEGKEGPAPYHPVRVWDVASRKEVLALSGFKQRPFRATFSPSGDEFLSAGSGADADMVVNEKGGKFNFGSAPKAVERLRVWDRDGKPGERFGPEQVVADAIWSKDEKRVYLFTQGGGQIWDPRSGQKVGDLEGPAMAHGKLSPDGKVLAGYYPSFNQQYLFVSLWDAKTGKKLA